MATLMLLGTFVGCTKPDNQNDKKDDDTAVVINNDYTVIRGDNSDELTTDAAIAVRNRINDEFGLNIALKTDFLMKDEKISEKEIIVGKTARDTEFDRTTLKENEYKVIVEGERIIIDAYDSMTLYYAIDEIMDAWFAAESCRNSNGELLAKADELAAISSTVDLGKRAIRFMSQNLRYTDDPDGNSISERSSRFQKLVADYSPDIIGTQETTAKWNTLLGKMFKEEYGIYEGFSRDGKGQTTGEYGTILYKKDRFEFIKGGTFWLSDTPNQKSKYEESSHFRICNYVILKDKNTDTEILFTNVHLNGGAVAEKQLKVMGEVLKDELAKYPAFLTGDFNARPDSTTYAYASKIMKDAYVTALDNKATIDYTAHDYGALTNAHRIDWCFYSGKMQCTSYNTLTDSYNGYVSDHYAVLAECILG